MREILFRGKRVDNVEWIEGYIVKLGRESFSDPERYGICNKAIPLGGSGVCYNLKIDEVIPETVGQYTGLTDRNGKPIFEGDIIKSGSYEFLVSHGKCGGCANTDNYGYIGFHLEPANEETKLHMGYGLRDDIYYYTGYYAEAEVMGNIHDNPELLKGGVG